MKICLLKDLYEISLISNRISSHVHLKKKPLINTVENLILKKSKYEKQTVLVMTPTS